MQVESNKTQAEILKTQIAAASKRPQVAPQIPMQAGGIQ